MNGVGYLLRKRKDAELICSNAEDGNVSFTIQVSA